MNGAGAMPRYFFNLRNEGFIPDQVGIELPGDDAARLEAWRLARLLPKTSEGSPQAVIVVTDDQGNAICEIGILS